MSHFFTPVERALLGVFGKTEKDVLVRYGKFLAKEIKMKKKTCPKCNSIMAWDGLGWYCKACGNCVDPTPEEVKQAVEERK